MIGTLFFSTKSVFRHEQINCIINLKKHTHIIIVKSICHLSLCQNLKYSTINFNIIGVQKITLLNKIKFYFVLFYKIKHNDFGGQPHRAGYEGNITSHVVVLRDVEDKNYIFLY